MLASNKWLKSLFALITTFIAFVGNANAEGGPATLLGDWGGVKAQLEEIGITADAIVTTDLMGNVSGGLDRTAGVLSKYNLSFAVDTENAGAWKGGTFFVYLLGSANRHTTDYVGAAQVVDNIDAYNTAKLYELFYSHSFFDDKFSFLVGLHDYNSEFDLLNYAAPLINSSFGIGIEIAQVGPSIFSTTSLAAMFKYNPCEHAYLKLAGYDGVPGDPENSRGTHIILKGKDGVFYAAEAGINSAEKERYYKFGVGAWDRTTDFENEAGRSFSNNQGIYSVGELMLLPESDIEQGLGAFYQLGFAKSDRNRFGNYIGAGFNYTGLFPGRDADALVAGMARAQTTKDYRDAVSKSTATETILELTYRLKIFDYLSMQPDFQYVINPNTDANLNHAAVVGMRIEAEL